MSLTSQSCVGPECPWVRGLSPPCWKQPVPGLQVVKGNHASWCHCIPLHYHDAWVAWVAQHMTLSTHKNGLEAASSPRPAISSIQLADALPLVPLPSSRSAHPGPLPQLLACGAAAAWQISKEGLAPWPSPPDHLLSSHLRT